jgi:hypothetical protein
MRRSVIEMTKIDGALVFISNLEAFSGAIIRSDHTVGGLSWPSFNIDDDVFLITSLVPCRPDFNPWVAAQAWSSNLQRLVWFYIKFNYRLDAS